MDVILYNKLTKVDGRVQSVEEDLGLVGDPINFGTGNPVNVETNAGVQVILESETADSCLIVGRNLYPNQTEEFERFKSVVLPIKFPAGTYKLTAFVTSTGSSGNYNAVYLFNGSSAASSLGMMERGKRSTVTLTANTEFDRIYWYADNSTLQYGVYGKFEDITLICDDGPTDYIPYVGETKFLADGVASFVSNGSAVSVFTNNLDDVHAYCETTAVPVIPKLTNEVKELDDTVGMEGEKNYIGVGNPLVIDELLNTKAYLEFSTANKYFTSGKNICPVESATFTRFKSVELGYPLPAGTYTLSLVCTSTDTDSDKCLVFLFDSTSAKSGSIYFNRGTRQKNTVTATGTFDRLYLYASNDYTPAAGDVATFSDIQIEIGTTDGIYEKYAGEEHDVQENNVLFITKNPMCIITDDGSNVSANKEVPPSGRMLDRQFKAEEKLLRPYTKYYGKKIVNFGDSIFGQIRPPIDISTNLANLTGATVYNCGFGGCRMSEHLSFWDAFSMYNLADSVASGDFSMQESALESGSGTLPAYFTTTVNLLKTINWNDVDAITIGYGTNDFTSDIFLDNENDHDDTTTIAGALRYSIETILTAYPHLKIFVCCPTYRFWMNEQYEFVDDSNTHTNLRNNTLLDVVDIEKSVASEYGVPFIDNYHALGFNKFSRTRYFGPTDGTHPNKNGTKLIAEHIAHEMW